MKILVIGSQGFVGRNVSQVLSAYHQVYGASRQAEETAQNFYLDMEKPETIARVLKQTAPDVIINCAGIVENSDKAKLNPVMTKNLVTEIVASGIKPQRIIILGSAAEYGIVDKLPVAEDAPLKATSAYGLSKIEDTSLALEFREKHNLPITVARLFNPIGADMPSRLLIPQIIKQVQEIQAGTKQSIEVSRLDAMRDYLNIKDVCLAFKLLIEGQPQATIYNIGSGKSMSTEDVLNIILKDSKLEHRPEVIQTAAEPEPLFASQADITRLQQEFGWQTQYPIDETIQEIMHATTGK